MDSAHSKHWNTSASIDELASLTEAAGALPIGRVVQRLKHPNSRSYIGKGKLVELIEMQNTLQFNVAIFDDELTPVQQRTLEDSLQIKVLDRTALILDIFAQRARTREGLLQVALAQHEYLLPRLAGQWSHLERMEGAIGLRGPGETQLETDRRLIRTQIKRLRGRIQQVRNHRKQYRSRREKAGIPIVALVGYTNSGKSTLMKAMTGANVSVNDRLFESLDPVTRRCRLNGELTVLLTDTVGFIQKLPTQLIAAFRATLEEIGDADLLLHVVDISHPEAPEQSQSVESTLEGLDLINRPRLTVFNKIDRVTGPGFISNSLRPGHATVNGGDIVPNTKGNDDLLISAELGFGLEGLRIRLAHEVKNCMKKIDDPD